jgi:hypothetical protein
MTKRQAIAKLTAVEAMIEGEITAAVAEVSARCPLVDTTPIRESAGKLLASVAALMRDHKQQIQALPAHKTEK